MKSTKIMLCVIATLLATWTLVSALTFSLSDLTFRDSFGSGSSIMFMLIIGWVPSVIVGSDLDKKIKS